MCVEAGLHLPENIGGVGIDRRLRLGLAQGIIHQIAQNLPLPGNKANICEKHKSNKSIKYKPHKTSKNKQKILSLILLINNATIPQIV